MIKNQKSKIKNQNLGFSLIETIIGIALMLVVFTGLFGVIQWGMKVVGQSKARITATALANQTIELARNLSYDNVGTAGGIPNGSIPETETIIRNKITYIVKTTVIYIDDPFDNTFPDDSLAWDYKRVKVKVSWPGFFGGQVSLQTDVAPKGIETTGSGGIISILVFDANGQPISQADVRVESASTSPPIDANYQTDNQGRLFVPGAPACSDCYKITASKTGYSAERTYAVGELVRGTVLAAPNKPFVSVLEGQLSEVSFTIDRLSAKTLQTIKYLEEKTWTDSFDDENQISDPITPADLVLWGGLNWTSTSTDIRFQFLHADGGDWVLIPDSDLTVDGVKNSDGFSVPPVDISELDSFKYPSIKIKANLPSDWTIAWFSSDTSAPVPNLAFAMQGAKTLGLDAGGQPIYKYQENLSTNNSGLLTISNLEWDSYKITVNGAATGYDIANSLPSQPVNTNPGISQTTILKLADHQTNTLLITVKDASGQPLAGAIARLYKTGYDKTKLTTDSGQTFFSPLTLAAYNLEITMAGYQDFSGQVNVSGQSEQTVIMTLP